MNDEVLSAKDILHELTILGESLKALHQRMDRMEKQLEGPLEVWAATAGGIKVLGWLGKGAKWVTIIAGACAAIYAALHFGATPAP